MLSATLFILSGVVTGLAVGLKVIAPRTSNKTDDKVLAVLEKYGVPLVEYLGALNAPKALPREQVRDHRK